VTWHYKDKVYDGEDIEKWSGFVYLITNLANGKKYIGKKLLWFSKQRIIKGKKKRTKVESDWRTYWSSSEDVKADVAKLGEENFKREILHFCLNKGSTSYYEAKEQFLNEVLEKPDEWYNGQIQCRIHRSHIKQVSK
jgi:hypothetical protein